MRARAQVWVALVAWVAVLVVLAALWVNSPWTGPGPMFLAWSAPAALLAAGTWIWLGRIGVTQVPRGIVVAVPLLAAWWAAAWLATTGAGAELALDADIMRRPVLRLVGIALEWLPGFFGLGVSLGGLAAVLEARYRVLHGEVGDVR